MTPITKPRRSVLYVPGANVKALTKAATLSADCIIFDLEDAVSPDAKQDARNNICAVLQENDYGHREIIVRVNGFDTQWLDDDIAALNGLFNVLDEKNYPTCLLPKIDKPAHIEKARTLLNPDCALWMMIETPLAILNISGLAQAAAQYNVQAFVMGTNDLSKELHLKMTDTRPPPLLFALSQALFAARHNDITIIDGVYNDIDNQAGFIEETKQGCAMGFDGKTLIHPSQIAPCNDIFAPTPEEVAEAQAILAAFAAPENKEAGVLRVNGKMVELLHHTQALRLLSIAEAIEANQA